MFMEVVMRKFHEAGNKKVHVGGNEKIPWRRQRKKSIEMEVTIRKSMEVAMRKYCIEVVMRKVNRNEKSTWMRSKIDAP